MSKQSKHSPRKLFLMTALATLVLAVALAAVGCTMPLPVTPEAPEVTVRTPQPTFTPDVEPDPAVPPMEVTPTPPMEVTPTPDDPEVTPTPTLPRERPERMDSPEYGMQAFLWWRPEVASRDVQVIRDAGFGWVKANFGWREIEPAKGDFDWSRPDHVVEMATDEGLDLLVRIDFQPRWAGGNYPVNGPPDDLQDLADFLYALASRYEGQIRAYQVWNEPNLAREWGGEVPNPGDYVELLGISYEAIKRADPGAMVISAGMSPTGTWSDEARPDDWFVESMYIAMGGSSEGYFDVLGAHGAGFASPPEADPSEVAADPAMGGHRSMAFRRVEDLREIMVEYGDADKQIALLEFGWTSDPRPESPYHWHAVSEETKAEYMVRAYQYAEENWSPWIGVMNLIYVANPDWTPEDEQYWWAITEPSYPEFQPRPAYLALKEMPK